MIVSNYADCAMNSSLKGKNLCKFIYNFLICNLFFPHYLLVTFSNLPRIFLFTFPPRPHREIREEPQHPEDDAPEEDPFVDSVEQDDYRIDVSLVVIIHEKNLAH